MCGCVRLLPDVDVPNGWDMFAPIRDLGHDIGGVATAKQRQLAPIGAQYDFCGVAVITRLILPFAGLELSLQVNCRAFLAALSGDLSQTFVSGKLRPFRSGSSRA